MKLAVLGLGSNLGNRLANLKKAVNNIYFMPGFDILAFSSVYETEPWGFKNQNNFLNCVIAGLYRFDAASIFKQIKIIEIKTGRVKRNRWHPREVDIDILFFGKKIIESKDLVIPHPQIKNRNFVLIPLLEIMPDYVHPVLRKRIKTLLYETNDKCKAVKTLKDLRKWKSQR
jgi:dihydroneopterin aldolase/2-amino-4-hydroxy-6-hydroxymethyldihydropteridine diphosphokinase